ncbi:MAG: hypothetical protein KF862_11750 [Chitinophagaceae bacterium]|nr:hypothetical protein [Chitinophagaceae bacterium]
MKKNFVFLFILGFPLTGIAQYHFIVLDSLAHTPIEHVNIVSSNGHEGTATNKDGFATLNLTTTNNLFRFSHVNYYRKELPANDKNTDTIYLVPIVYSMPEVIISNLDLNKKFSYILKNYNQLYVDYPVLRQGTYKETIRSHDTLTRLMVAEVDWWSPDLSFNFNSPISKFCKIDLKNIKAFRNTGIISTSGANIGIALEDFLSRLYLNFILESIVKNTKISLLNTTKSETALKVNFETNEFKIPKRKEAVAKFSGECDFDIKSGAIVFFNVDVLLSNYSTQGYNPDYKLSYKSNTQKISLKLVFENRVDPVKYSLSYASMSILATTYLQHQIIDSDSETTLYITKEAKSGAFEGTPLDYTVPIYKAVPSHKNNFNTISLSKEEIEFVK